MTKRPIVHPTDFSPASRPALAKAIELAKAGGSATLVLHVLNPSRVDLGSVASCVLALASCPVLTVGGG
jgi:nucleotide-binding universal stress UspA family protein